MSKVQIPQLGWQSLQPEVSEELNQLRSVLSQVGNVSQRPVERASSIWLKDSGAFRSPAGQVYRFANGMNNAADSNICRIPIYWDVGNIVLGNDYAVICSPSTNPKNPFYPRNEISHLRSHFKSVMVLPELIDSTPHVDMFLFSDPEIMAKTGRLLLGYYPEGVDDGANGFNASRLEYAFQELSRIAEIVRIPMLPLVQVGNNPFLPTFANGYIVEGNAIVPWYNLDTYKLSDYPISQEEIACSWLNYGARDVHFVDMTHTAMLGGAAGCVTSLVM